MKKLVTILLVAILAASCICVFAACEKPLADTDGFSYVITGDWNGWKVNVDPDDETKLDAQYAMEAIALSDSRVKSIKDQLEGVKLLYIGEHEFVNEGAGWDITVSLTEGATPSVFNGNMAIKVLQTKYETLGDASSWSGEWIPNAKTANARTLTPDTLYIPPFSEVETYTGSLTWKDNPVALEAGTYYVVFAAFTDGTFGLGLIAK